MATITYEQAEQDERYGVHKNGAIYDIATGRIVAMPNGGKTAITPANTGEMRQRWEEQKALSRLRGLCKAVDIDPDDIDQDIIRGGGTAVEMLTEHMARTFLGSTNLRGMSESFRTLANVTDAGTGERHPVDASDLARIVEAIERIQERTQPRVEVVDAE